MPRTFITVSQIHKHYGSNAIFDGASAEIRDDHRLAVIGRNGAGKSTLCRMILGEEEIDAGRIAMHGDLRLSYLEQHDPFHEGESVNDFLMRYSGQPDWRCGKLAARMLLGSDILVKAVSALSGGFQTRVKLAAMLLKEPNFLILDEPTNYLDLTTVMLLEDFLRSFDGGYLIVSHDREFLKRTCTGTMDVANGEITIFPGDVEKWLAYKEGQMAQAAHANVGLEARRKQLQDFVDRNKAKASKATQAASKVKMLEKLQPIEIEHSASTVSITIPKVESRTGTALRVTDMSIGYPGKTVATGIELEIERGSRVAVIGDNGQGKTTFLSTVAGALKPIAGSFKWGFDIRVGTYAQHVYAAIDGKLTVMNYLQKCADSGPGHTPTQQIQDLAGSFLFRGRDIDKHVKVLSGGERSRLCLAGLLLQKCPVLILDEPTNHLDFETVEALAEALQGYDGTLFFTSHDRTFVKLVSTDVVEVRDGRVALYGDGYDNYVYRIQERVRAASAEAASGKGGDKKAAERPRDDVNKLRGRLKQLERRIGELDAEKKKLEKKLNDAYDHADGERLGAVLAELEKCETEWVDVSEKVG